ncbi:MAG: hypothetical protein A3F26_00290 [Candidatus Ryanbacteria bacterium RIFCSPHIGHO2_12_FULL_47_12b]|uniref:CBS domain-containing protein n=2 Tax=Candidatus Ryaniibacteriota TaxID=1817914 RepID=A0A1G2H4B5_9BACT|nr:MAG: Mg2+ transporter [Parcubacteria group bacterium GW2011_GWA1_47_9]OGZ46905.1 MAG: hypothetical protein A2844_00150 [Candidatus Ryanbacteria bacterium RIFCSPHIGHO2_01_FULL_48_80]OGZ50424.1 MAG: hypothetical protein A3C83_00065 [Candidatus Ryanbacteria bacterium RIFCSPHIGHO2_02_FULL_47_25]OGZ51842.1 MAG: hypothetical protein A3F26_00290 [Candidatus Ryanbacteria bacterium RIFCSPHIGHO2_12_FULL_47_12b]OGZ53110.1 MAG: hypothetical protein A3A29_02490 [Candidatus Ryanbacteria bacterium RIFCSPLO
MIVPNEFMLHKDTENQKWPWGSAGRNMTDKIPVVLPSYTLGDVIQYLRLHIKEFDTINYVYVADKDKKLVGTVSIKDLYTYEPETKVVDIFTHGSLVTVPPTTDREEVSYIALKHNIKAVPVVGTDGALLGIVPDERILSIVYQELHEDILHLAGVHRAHADYDNILEIPLLKTLAHRVPWLLVGLLGGLLAARVIGSFEKILQENLILAAFIPLIVYIADAVGTQLEAFTIRDFVLFRKLNIVRYAARQFLTVLIIATLLGGMLMAVSYGFYGYGVLPLILGIAVFSAVLSSLVTGLFIPFSLRKFGFDPANASGPIGTIVQDILSILIYFVVASLLV